MSAESSAKAERLNTASEPDCNVCRSLSGEQRIAPGPAIYEGSYWVVEHAYPTSLAGWLVIVLKRHCRALHELSTAEFKELALLQRSAAQVLFRHFQCQKEYMACFAEKPGFTHLHIHVMRRPADLPAELRGTAIFKAINPDAEEQLPDAQIIAESRALARLFLECVEMDEESREA